MTILAWLQKLTGLPVDKLIDVLEAVANGSTDLAPIALELLSKLREELSHADLVTLAKELPAEVIEIIKGHLEPKDHPSDAA